MRNSREAMIERLLQWGQSRFIPIKRLKECLKEKSNAWLAMQFEEQETRNYNSRGKEKRKYKIVLVPTLEHLRWQNTVKYCDLEV